MCIATVPPLAVLATLKDQTRKKEWDLLLKETCKLEILDDKTGPDIIRASVLSFTLSHETEIHFDEYQAIWPTAGREFLTIRVCFLVFVVLARHVWQLSLCVQHLMDYGDDGVISIMGQSIEYESKQPDPRYVLRCLY
jgi:hypothetical protein